jgi:hypothetical protein
MLRSELPGFRLSDKSILHILSCKPVRLKYIVTTDVNKMPILPYMNILRAEQLTDDNLAADWWWEADSLCLHAGWSRHSGGSAANHFKDPDNL